MLVCLFGAWCIAAEPAPDISQRAYDAAMELKDAGRLSEAEMALQELVEARTQKLGAEHRETLLARMKLLEMGIRRNKDAGAETEARALLHVMEHAGFLFFPFILRRPYDAYLLWLTDHLCTAYETPRRSFFCRYCHLAFHGRRRNVASDGGGKGREGGCHGEGRGQGGGRR
ncbi:hypothetical protein [Prosthecobacter sp.]|uniref:hypothetical protein n=1 Tax=Prosthecobacter sp. TaxID=1965333 RepID=UPI003783F066